MLLIPRKRSEPLEICLQLGSWKIYYTYDSYLPGQIALDENALLSLIEELNLFEFEGTIRFIAEESAGFGYYNPADSEIVVSISSRKNFFPPLEQEIDGDLDASLILAHELRHAWQGKNWPPHSKLQAEEEEDADSFEIAYFEKIVSGLSEPCVYYIDQS